MPADITTNTLETPEATLAYDVCGPLPTHDGRPVLLMIGHPMDASGFATQASLFEDRTVVTYDPRGLGRSARKDGGTERTAEQQAQDIHDVIVAIGGGPVDLFGSSGGAIAGLALVTAYPNDVATLIAHEPPLIEALPDAEQARAAWYRVHDVYHAKGSGSGMASFMGMTMWQGEFTEAYLDQPDPDPTQFGMSAEDDGTRGDPLLSGVARPITDYRIDVGALRAAPTRIVIGVGEESLGTFTGRTSEGTAHALGQEATVFPSHHGGFLGPEFGYPGKPEEFAVVLRRVLE
jgi:pimeloyl-ACP methyl ester carboxylesterase